MRTQLAALIAIMFLANPVKAKDLQDAFIAYETGNYQKALELIAPKAKDGHPRAQFNLGMMHFKGNGVKKDYGKALEWFHKAAQQGYAEAQSNLGLLYANGMGIPQNFIKAYAWWDIATEQGNIDAKYNRIILENRMDLEQISEAKILSSKFWEMYVMPFQYY
ncbi:MAG: hypothetical protein CL569_00705 [Alphaproteobacteria bacterium]|nr:hypothetical protein [Alphaproteobacteria bacterium]|tara:strand:- start:83 stop:571 length:489 start_codon:yes stop_codon:yes gene_type:complete